MPVAGPTELRRRAEALQRDAADLDDIRHKETTARAMWVHSRRVAVHAVKQLLAAEACGANLLRLWAPDPPGVPHRPGHIVTVDQKNDDSLFWYWRMIASPILRGLHPDEFGANAGAFEFPTAKTDARGRVLGRNGKPIRIIRGNGGSLRTTEPAYINDDYTEAESLSHERARCRDWADACRAASRLLAERAELAIADPVQIPKRRKRGPRERYDERADADFVEGWKAAKAAGANRELYCRNRGKTVNDLIAAQDRCKYRRRRDAE
jgi:hypothetical protein